MEKETRTPASKFQYANVSKLLNREVYMANLRDLSTGTCHVYCIFDCKVYSASDKKSDASVYYFSVGGSIHTIFFILNFYPGRSIFVMQYKIYIFHF